MVDIEGECCFGSRVLGEAACGEQVLIFAGDRIQEGTLERWIPEKRTHVAMIKSKARTWPSMRCWSWLDTGRCARACGANRPGFVGLRRRCL